jgi:hypothetical protein
MHTIEEDLFSGLMENNDFYFNRLEEKEGGNSQGG